MKKTRRQPPRPATVDDGIKELLAMLQWRVRSYYEVRGAGNRAESSMRYDSYFAYEAARRLARLLLWKARRHAPPFTVRVRGRVNPPALVDVRRSSGPDELVRRQRRQDA